MPHSRPLQLMNTFGRRVEEFQSIEPGKVRMYTCGPTVYSFAHIGNFRAFIVADTLRRVLEYNGYEVRYIRNITDVGHLTNDEIGAGPDKIEEAARKQHISPWELAASYTEAFLKDAQRLNLVEPTSEPRATEYVEKMIDMVRSLIDAGKGYAVDGSVYYDVTSFPRYGKLSGNTIQDLIAGARVEVDEEKRSPADFALWKSAGKDKIMRWESPWGEGVPGWHLECSAMAMDLLGEQIDIHTGGVDHIFPHHEDEIAQSEGVTGKRFARFWLHNEFLQLTGDEKMSKSRGSILTVSDLVEGGIHPLSFRYFTFQAHYRTPLNFSWRAVGAAQTALVRIWEQAAELYQDGQREEPGVEAISYRDRFHEAVNRDLDLPGAVAVTHDVLSSKLEAGQKLGLFQDFDRVLALDILPMAEALSRVSPEEKRLLEKRAGVRQAKDFKRSDELRAELAAGGLDVKDSARGQRWARNDILPRGNHDTVDGSDH
ncbi:MAG: cysteine--tRNA ligase [Chloroflexota bacterium]